MEARVSSLSKAPPARAPPRKDNDADPPLTRTVIHTDAYKKRENLGPHLDIVVTPPEKRGKKGRVLVELYNYSKAYVSVADFWLDLYSATGDRVEVHITADDLKGGWSALKWVKIGGKKATPFPRINRVAIEKMQVFDATGKKFTLKHYVDLIKE